jgi:hypothetical protein
MGRGHGFCCSLLDSFIEQYRLGDMQLSGQEMERILADKVRALELSKLCFRETISCAASYARRQVSW